jgi:hypothetical protein
VISTRHRFIFIHAPKTAGNSLQELLLPFSDDTKTTTAHQDGVERFGIAGAVTKRKHATLADYEAALGHGGLERFTTFCVVRNPWERALSDYFSPHRWMEKRGAAYVAVTPEWDETRFLAGLSDLKPVSDFMKDGSGRFRADFVIRFESLDVDVAAAWARLGLPGSASLPHRNRKPPGFDGSLYRQAPHLVEAVAQAMAEDIARWNYAPPDEESG